jgi:exodeoxyribonuclease-5
VFALLDDFLINSRREKQVFLLKGYAGTGKTTIVSRLIEILSEFDFKYVMMAPTGRAAKVMASYSGKKAFTIHKHIYMKDGDEMGGDFVFRLKANLAGKTIYIIDEASMISDEISFGSSSLLADLFKFVFEKKSNRLLIIGDSAQLPPVKQNLSPALDPGLLKAKFDIQLTDYELKEVVRQEAKSGILENATSIRESIRKNEPLVKLRCGGFKDFFRMGGERLEEGLNYAYSKFGVRNTMIITRSNRSATEYNKYIRSRIHYAEEELQNGDMLIVVRNNYNVLPEEISGGFLANGDFVEVVKVRRSYEMHGFRFADVSLKLIDEPGEPEFDAKVLLDLLYSYSPSLSQEENNKLYQSVMLDYADIKSVKERRAAIKKDPFLNALQVKFAYALTCHKSQGGQWDAVFVDQGYMPDENYDVEYLRWLYTAVTRATSEVFMVNFNARFF